MSEMMRGANNPEMGVTLSLDDQMSPKLTQAEQNLQLTAQRMRATGAEVRNIGVALTAAGVAGLYATNKLVQGAGETEEAYARVNTMLGAGENALEDYGSAIKSLTREIPIQGGEVAALDGMYQVLSAGIEHGADATMVLEAAMKAAVGGMTSTEQSVNILTTALNAYGMAGDQATYVTDVLSLVVMRGKTTYDELASTLGNALATAAQVGVGLEQVGAAVATLTKAGISTEETVTAINQAMLAFLKPSEAMQAQIIELGYSSGSAMMEALGFQGSLDALAKATGGSAEAMAGLFPNVRALKAVLPLTGKMADVAAEDLAAMGDAAGTAGKMYEDMANTTLAQMTKLDNRMQQARDSIAKGATPAMLKLKEAGASTMEGIAKLNEETDGAVGAMLAFGSATAAVVGPIVAAIGQLTLYRANKLQIAVLEGRTAAARAANTASLVADTAVTNTATGAKWTLTAATTALNAALKGTMGLMFGVGLAVAGLVMAVGYVHKKYTEYKEDLKESNDRMKEHLDALDDGTEGYKRRSEELKEIAKHSKAFADSITLQLIEEEAQRDSFDQTSERAEALRKEYTALRNEQRKTVTSSNPLLKALGDLTGATEAHKKAVKEDADALFGYQMSEGEATIYLINRYQMSNEAARAYAASVDYLTAASLDQAVAAERATMAENNRALSMEIATRKAEAQNELVGLSYDELREKQAELNAEYDVQMALHRQYLEIDPALSTVHGNMAINMLQELELVDEMISLREDGLRSIEETIIGYDNMTDAIIGTYAATKDLASDLAGLDFAPDLSTQLTILDDRLERVSESWANLFGDPEDLEYSAERMRDIFQDQVDKIPEMINLGYTGEQMLETLVAGLRSSGVEVSDAIYDILRDYVAAYLELHSPAKKGPLSRIHKYWEPMGGMLAQGFQRGLTADPANRLGVKQAALPPTAGSGVTTHTHGDINININGYNRDPAALARMIAAEVENVVM